MLRLAVCLSAFAWIAVNASIGAAQECVDEGGSVAVVPNAPQCCEGLSPISCNQPAEGVCPDRPCLGARICAACGDGACGAGENECNCAADCGDTGSNLEEGSEEEGEGDVEEGAVEEGEEEEIEGGGEEEVEADGEESVE